MQYPALNAPLARAEVALVGAGPGEPGLLTLAAASLIGNCDAIVYDALVSGEILNMAAAGTELISAGKRGGRPSASQQDICNTLLKLAKEGKRVVRLKGGDPFVFGRGGEEVRALAAAGIRFRVIPGITAGVAAPAMAGIPVTDRSVNATLAFFTGHEAGGKSSIAWRAMVEAFPVLVLYMASRNLDRIATALLQAGMAEETPLAVVHAASLPDETVIEATLLEAASGGIDAASPSIIIIGDVVTARVPWRRPVQTKGDHV